MTVTKPVKGKLGRKSGDPEIGERLRALRKRTQSNQTEFAELLGVSQEIVSHWEKARYLPSPMALMAIGNLAGDEREWWYERAGKLHSQIDVLRHDLRAHLHATDGEYTPRERAEREHEIISVPLLKDAAAAGEPRINYDEIEDFLPMPRSLCPHPDSTRCVKVKGSSMLPIIRDGDIAAVDVSRREARELIGDMVAAGNPEGGVTLKWLRKSGSQYLLVPQHTSPRFNPVVLSEDKRWRIIGRVIWWIGFPPPKK